MDFGFALVGEHSDGGLVLRVAAQAGEEKADCVGGVGDAGAGAGEAHDGGGGWEVVGHCEAVLWLKVLGWWRVKS